MGSIKSTWLPRSVSTQSQIEVWAEGLIRRWLDKMDSLGIHDSGNLARSFRFTVEWESRMMGDNEVDFLHRIHFTYMFYGKMVDYGLGAGTDIKDRFETGRDENENRRKRKRWISEPFQSERLVLLKIIQRDAIFYTKAILRSKFEDAHEIGFKTRNNK